MIEVLVCVEEDEATMQWDSPRCITDYPREHALLEPEGIVAAAVGFVQVCAVHANLRLRWHSSGIVSPPGNEPIEPVKPSKQSRHGPALALVMRANLERLTRAVPSSSVTQYLSSASSSPAAALTSTMSPCNQAWGASPVAKTRWSSSATSFLDPIFWNHEESHKKILASQEKRKCVVGADEKGTTWRRVTGGG